LVKSIASCHFFCSFAIVVSDDENVLQLSKTIAIIETNTSQCFSTLLDDNTFALSKKINHSKTNIMKALIIIAACLTLALVLRIAEVLIARKPINSVGAKANDKSNGIAKIDVTNPESVAEAVAHYKHLDD